MKNLLLKSFLRKSLFLQKCTILKSISKDDTCEGSIQSSMDGKSMGVCMVHVMIDMTSKQNEFIFSTLLTFKNIQYIYRAQYIYLCLFCMAGIIIVSKNFCFNKDDFSFQSLRYVCQRTSFFHFQDQEVLIDMYNFCFLKYSFSTIQQSQYNLFSDNI